MKGYIVDASYTMVNDRSVVTLYGRSSQGEPFLTTHKYKSYFFIKETDLKETLKLVNVEFEKTKLKNFADQNVTKIYVDIPSELKKLRKILLEHGIECFESDIPLARRFLMDHSIKGCIEINGERSFQADTLVLRNPELIPISCEPNLIILSIDIETDMQGEKIFSIAMVTKTQKHVIVINNKPIKNAEIVDNEEDLIERFFELLEDINPDVITGWNVINFDLKIIRSKCQELEIPFILGRGNSPTKMYVRDNFFESSTVKATGRQVVDALSLVRSYEKLESYKLEFVAQKILGKGKVKGIDIQNMESFLKKNPQKFVDYNLQDAELVLLILEKSGALEINIKKSIITGLMLSEVNGSIASLDNIYIPRLHEIGYVAPSIKGSELNERITGGYVMDSVPGLYNNIVVLDFKSLYPSIMRTFNIDPLAFGRKGIQSPNGATFSRDLALLPKILQEIWIIREQYKRCNDKAGSYAMKILLNSFFGVLASPMCRFYSLEIGNAITSFAQLYIKKTATLIEKEGYQVIYSDTDSVFVKIDANPNKIGKQLETNINKILSKEILREHKVKSYLELEFEKTYTKFLMPKLRGGTKGAKKRYAGLVNGKLQITGLEAVRGDWTKLAKKFQIALLTIIFEDKDPAKFIKGYIQDLKKGKYDDLLTYKKQIRKPLESYKVTPPHVKAARQLPNFRGPIIEYIYSKDGVVAFELSRKNYDYEHYISKQLKPIAESILVFFNLNFEEIMSGQKSIFGF
jgi:DNA polymerase II